jgi:hypothetical protein
MQLWLCIMVFMNDYQCRTSFCDDKYFIVNENKCIDSLNQSTTQPFCACRFDGIRYNGSFGDMYCWLKISDDLSVFLASIPVFIPLMIITIYREGMMLVNNLGFEDYKFNTFQYFSVFGFIAIILDPMIGDEYIQSTYEEASMIMIDIGAIGLVFQYSSFIGASLTDQFFLITLIASCCNVLKSMCIIRHINLKLRNKLQQKSYFSIEKY